MERNWIKWSYAVWALGVVGAGMVVAQEPSKPGDVVAKRMLIPMAIEVAPNVPAGTNYWLFEQFEKPPSANTPRRIACAQVTEGPRGEHVAWVLVDSQTEPPVSAWRLERGTFITTTERGFLDSAPWPAETGDQGQRGLWELSEGGQPALTYVYGDQLPEGVPQQYRRSTYIHPIYGLDGEVLTDDFPKDHYHHRGLFWTYAQVTVGGQTHDLWAVSGIKQRFEKLLYQQFGRVCAVIGVQNGWYVGEKRVVDEKVWLRVFRADDVGRAIDLDVILQATDAPVVLGGRPGVGYSGLTLRFAPRTDTTITTSDGPQPADSDKKPFKWADLSARFAGRQEFSGAAMFEDPRNPGWPNGWTLRNYGILDSAWPGVSTYELKPGQPVRIRHRIWVHRGNVEEGKVAAAYEYFANPPKIDLRVSGP